MKKAFFFFIIGIIISILIYNQTVNKKLDVLVIGDSLATGNTLYGNSGISYNLYLKEYLSKYNLGKYDLEYTKTNMTIKDFIYYVDENNEINDKHLQTRIKEAEIIIISLGQDELVGNSQINNLNYQRREEFYTSYNSLFNKIRKINKKKVYILGFYGSHINNLDEIETNIKKISKRYNINYIKIKDFVNEEDYFDHKLIHLNYKGHKKIFEQLKKELTL